MKSTLIAMLFFSSLAAQAHFVVKVPVSSPTMVLQVQDARPDGLQEYSLQEIYPTPGSSQRMDVVEFQDAKIVRTQKGRYLLSYNAQMWKEIRPFKGAEGCLPTGEYHAPALALRLFDKNKQLIGRAIDLKTEHGDAAALVFENGRSRGHCVDITEQLSRQHMERTASFTLNASGGCISVVCRGEVKPDQVSVDMCRKRDELPGNEIVKGFVHDPDIPSEIQCMKDFDEAFKK